ncbi:MAG: MerR family transcriptional regulator [Pelagibacteraceae bacterium]|jgi:DNA-binding transcriptional MerR regulator
MNNKNIKLLNISEASKVIGLINKNDNSPSTHVLRFWETKFKQLKPTILKGRRYYSSKDIDIAKQILFLLKEQGLTIKGAKKVMDSRLNKLDDESLKSVKADYYKNKIKTKSKEILTRIKKLNG